MLRRRKRHRFLPLVVSHFAWRESSCDFGVQVCEVVLLFKFVHRYFRSTVYRFEAVSSLNHVALETELWILKIKRSFKTILNHLLHTGDLPLALGLAPFSTLLALFFQVL